jgi:hypothetical protein
MSLSPSCVKKENPSQIIIFFCCTTIPDFCDGVGGILRVRVTNITDKDKQRENSKELAKE